MLSEKFDQKIEIVSNNIVNSSIIITGERVQKKCDIYIGTDIDFNYNSKISIDKIKHININNINSNFDNPYKIFCYSHHIDILSTKIHYFLNKFILFTHNSDENINNSNKVMIILNYNKLEKWYAQNLCFYHNKLNLLPIGLANSMWLHGDLTIFNDTNIMNNLHNKTKKIYFNFNINTNSIKREECYTKLKNKLEWLSNIKPSNNLYRLKDYEFCICPEGNGVDTHRLWEALYLRVVPIVINNEFINIIKQSGIPLVILNNWDDLNINSLNYTSYNFDKVLYINNF